MKKIILVILLTLAFGIGVYAFYEKVFSPTSININYQELENTYTVSVDNEFDLIKVSMNKYFMSKISHKDARKIIKFNNNITLSKDLYIDSDVLIDLNSKTLNLNSYNVVIKHEYFSHFSLYNGVITNTTQTSFIYIEVINSTVSLENITGSEYINLNYYDYERSCNEILDFYTRITKKYYLDDVFIFDNYKNYPINITYTSTNTFVLNSLGIVTRLLSNQEVVFSIILEDKNNIYESKSKSFDLVILGTDLNNLINPAIEVIDDYFSNYLDINSNYVYTDTINLIESDPYYEVSYKYFINEEEVTYLYLNKTSVNLNVLVYKDNTLLHTKIYTFYSNCNYLEASEYIDEIGLLLYKEDYLQIALDKETDYEVSFTLHQEEEFYTIDSNTLIKNQTPTSDDYIFIDYTFTFETGYPLVISKTVRVYYDETKEEGELGLTDIEEIFYEVFTIYNNVNEFSDFTLPNSLNDVDIFYKVIIPNYILQKYPYTASIFDQTKVKNGVFELDYTNIPPEDFQIEIYLYFGIDNYDTAPYPRYLTYKIDGLLLTPRDVTSPILYESLQNTFNFNTSFGNLVKVSDCLNYNLEFILDLNSQTITSLKGLEYLENITILTLTNGIISNLIDIETYINSSSIKILNLTYLSLDSATLSYIPYLPNLEELDLSNNSITNFNYLKTYPKVHTLKVYNNDILDYSNILFVYNIKKLYLDAFLNNFLDLDYLTNLNYLNEIFFFNILVDTTDTYVPIESVFLDKYITKYIIMYNLFIKFYYKTYDQLVAPPTIDEVEIGLILESIYYFKTQTTIILPSSLKTSNNTIYNLNWYYEDVIITTNNDFTVVLKDDLIEITQINKSSITLKVELTINQTTLLKEIVIQIN